MIANVFMLFKRTLFIDDFWINIHFCLIQKEKFKEQNSKIRVK